LGDIYPKQFELVLKEWNRMEHFRCVADFKLSSLLHDLQKVGRSRLLFLSQDFLTDFLTDLTHLKTLGGEFSLDLEYEGSQDSFAFNILGRDVLLEQHHIKELTLSGYMRDNRWAIEQLQLDQISIAAELHRAGDLWKADFLGLRYGDAFLMGLEGSYRYGDPHITAKIHLLEADLDRLPKWEMIRGWMEKFEPKGTFKGRGEIAINHLAGWNADVQLTGSWKDFQLDNIRFQDAEDFHVRFQTGKSLTISNLKSAFTWESEPGFIHFDVKELQYDFPSEKLSCAETSFSIDANRLHWLSTELQKRFSSVIDETMGQWIAHLKPCRSEPVKGSFQWVISPQDRSFLLKLQDDRYYFKEKEFLLRNFTLNLKQNAVDIAAIYTQYLEPLWISLRCDARLRDRGEVLISNADLSQPGVLISWRKDPEAGMIIEKAQGQLRGMIVDLCENASRPSTPNIFSLTGSIDVDCTYVKNMVPPGIAQTFTLLEMGKGYRMQGEWEIGKNHESGQDLPLRFSGLLLGSDMELKGYCFKQLSARMIFDPYAFHLLDCTLSDPAGTMYIGSLRADRLVDDSWHLSVPLVTVYEMRPSLLREAHNPSPLYKKPLVVRQFYIQDITGTLGQAASFKGYGTLLFVNPKRNSLQNTIFAIPAEILTRIGLNLSVLTPVQGTIHFKLNKGNFELTKFKHVYSDRKISRFYLPSAGITSTIDFDGNLNIQVRFKQSTLLLKLVEMFTIHINGTIKKPVYTLHRQKYLIHKEVFASNEEESEPHALTEKTK
jgi:hypothetical protein